jgi:hypothetical protein
VECLAWASTLWPGGVGIRFASRTPLRFGRRLVGDPAGAVGAFFGLAWQCDKSHRNDEDHACHEAHQPENVVVHRSLIRGGV